MVEVFQAEPTWPRRAARIGFVCAAVFTLIMAALPHPPPVPGNPPDEIQHMLAFAALGVLSAAGFRDRSIVGLFVALAAFGAAIEFVQAIPVLNRDSDLFDWLADLVAAFAALWATRGLLKWDVRRRARKAS